MNILVVDDEAVSRQAVSEIVEAATGRAPSTAEDGLAAWERLDGGEPVVMVLSDIRMPRMDGLELLARLRGDRRFEHLPVMLISSAADRSTVQNAVRTGVQGFVLKPATLDAVDRVRHVIDQFRRSLLDGSREAMQRLGVDEGRFRAYVDALVTQGQSLADRIAEALQAESEAVFKELVAAVHNQRMAAVTMGARRLEQVLGAVESGLHGFAQKDRSALPGSLACYRLNLYWLQCMRERPLDEQLK